MQARSAKLLGFSARVLGEAGCPLASAQMHIIALPLALAA